MDWFDLAFDAASAFNQVMILTIGIGLAGMGGAMIAGHFYKGKKVRKVKATIVGVREQVKSGKNSGNTSTPIYFPVFEYVGPSGDMIRAESDSGSSFLADKVPGTRVDIFVSPDRPERAGVPGKVLLVIGAALFVVGVAIAIYALSVFPFTILSAVIGVLVLGFAAFNIKKAIKPRDQWESPSAFMQRTNAAFLEKRTSLPMLEKAEVQQRLKKSDKQSQKWAPLVMLIGLGLCGGGLWVGSNLMTMLDEGVRVQGIVVDMKQTHDSDNGYNYYPIVRFSDEQGRERQFTSRVGTNPPINRVGDEVTVLFLPDNPEEAMIDRGLWNWLLPGLLFLAGAVLLFGTAAYQAGVKRRLTRF